MKNILSLLVLCAILSSCEDEYKNPNRCVEVPCPSSFSAKVNGKSFLPETQSVCDGTSASYYPEGDKNVEAGFLTLRGTDCPDFLRLGMWFASIYDTGTFSVSDTSNYIYWRDSTITGELYDNPIAGQIKLTHLQARGYDHPDKKWGRVKGTFWATLLNELGDTVYITDGKFDLSLKTFSSK